jgi:hypothetical protein
MRFNYPNLSFLSLFLCLALFSCENDIQKVKNVKNSFSDTTRKVNYLYNSRLGSNHAQELGINLIPDGDYNLLKQQIKTDKKNLSYKYSNATDKQFILDSTKKYLTLTLLNKILPYWYGMSWSMSGYSDIPQTGEVGCSYFVANTLLHLGFNINRFKIGKAASEFIAKTFQLSQNVIILNDYTNEELTKYVKSNLEEGFYVVGLDCHVGYLLYYSNEVFFIHSSYIFPGTVVIEYGNYSRALNSQIHVIGEITMNDSLIVKWLNNEFIPVIE